MISPERVTPLNELDDDSIVQLNEFVPYISFIPDPYSINGKPIKSSYDKWKDDFLLAEYRLITNVLNEYLNRKPVDEDFKAIVKYQYSGSADRYSLCYNHELLGTVIFDVDTFKCTFTPHEK
ncbi:MULTISPECIES: hypothetical protein [unclassified Sphingobacterium]|uniref:hypothetical protein n=1 Tax=unclassified Sphingobacterium TaxID=2609468 RepID=UPI0025D1B123|nr:MULTISPECIES: hypothetical protein [unclassified Sphingobacterium]